MRSVCLTEIGISLYQYFFTFIEIIYFIVKMIKIRLIWLITCECQIDFSFCKLT